MLIKTTVAQLYDIRMVPINADGTPTGNLFKKITNAVSSNNYAIMRLCMVMDGIVSAVTAIEKQRHAIYKKYSDEKMTPEGVPTGELQVRDKDKESFAKEMNDFMSSEGEFKFDYLLDLDDLNAAGISLSVPEIKILEPILDKRKLNLRLKQHLRYQDQESDELEHPTSKAIT